MTVAHPDDEYAFAATIYRLTHKLGWFTLLPLATSHAHHRAAAALSAEALEGLAPERRPVLLRAEARSREATEPRFAGKDPDFVFGRTNARYDGPLACRASASSTSESSGVCEFLAPS